MAAEVPNPCRWGDGIDSPDGNPHGIPDEGPLETHVENPDEVHDEDPVEIPLDNPDEVHVENPVATPVDSPDEGPVGIAIDNPDEVPDALPLRNPLPMSLRIPHSRRPQARPFRTLNAVY